MTEEQIQEKMKVLIQPVQVAIMSCESTEDVVMLASIMLTTAMEMLENAIGPENTDLVISEMIGQRSKNT